MIELSSQNILLFVFTALMLGVNKAGLPVSIFVVPIMAAAIGGKVSAGIILPLLLVGDIFAVIYYKKHADSKPLLKLLPWAIVGILLGLFVGSSISDDIFKKILSVIIFSGVILMILPEKFKADNNLTNQIWYSPLLGVLTGFSTMIGNAAGPLMNIYFLSMGLEKNSLIGTRSWFTIVINAFKIPLYFFVWKNITIDTLLINFKLIPIIIAGFFFGIFLLKFVSDKVFRYILISMTILAAVNLF